MIDLNHLITKIIFTYENAAGPLKFRGTCSIFAKKVMQAEKICVYLLTLRYEKI